MVAAIKGGRGYGGEANFTVGLLHILDPYTPHHKVHINLEYHSVCPLVGIGTPPPPPTVRYIK
jgi:hypothetical protein